MENVTTPLMSTSSAFKELEMHQDSCEDTKVGGKQ